MAQESLYRTAARQLGYFTVEQAHEAGMSSRMVLHHAGTGRFTRAARAVYRFRDHPDAASDFPLAWLVVVRLAGGEAVVSHESALYLHELGDVLPRAIDVTVPRSQRGIKLPAHPPIRLHTTMGMPVGAEVEERGGVRVTAPIRTIVDCVLAHTEGEQLIRAVHEARERGWLTTGLLLAEAAHRGPEAHARVGQFLIEAAAER